MLPASRRRVLRSFGSLSIAVGFAGCSGTGSTDGCGDDPPANESQNVESSEDDETPPLRDGAWPQPAYDEGNTRYSPSAAGVEAPARLVWSQSVAESAVVPVVADGTVYAVDDADRLTALDARTGSMAWRFDEATVTRPVSTGDEVVFVAGEDGLHAVDAETREVRWTFEPSDSDRGGATVPDRSANPGVAPTVTDATVYVALGDPPRVYAVDRETGTLRWDADGQQVAGVSDDAVFVHADGVLVAADPDDGTTRWTASLRGGTDVAVADGRVYGLLDAATVAAFDADSGAKRWEFERPHELLAPPSVSPDGVFVATSPAEGGDGGNLFALGRDAGDVRWCAHLGFERVRSPAVTDETVFVPRSYGLLQARAVEDGELRWQFFEEQADFESVAVVGSVAFAGTADGDLYAFAPA
jgi:outer membrane protein assembly factor BamB